MPSPLTRRKFIVANSAAVLTAQITPPLRAAEAASSADAGKLAKEGGPKAVQSKPGPWKRWGEAEKAQLNSAVDQPSIFYWGGRGVNQRTALFIERFKQHCPREHVVTCSSGTAAVDRKSTRLNSSHVALPRMPA